MPEHWLAEVRALMAKLYVMPGRDYALARQGLKAAEYWLERAVDPPKAA